MVDLHILEKIYTIADKYPKITYKREEKILRPNEYANNIYVVRKGLVRLYKVMPTGQEISFSRFNIKKSKVVIFGYTALLSKFYVEAVTDVVLQRVPKDEFNKFLLNNPQTEEFILEDLYIGIEEMMQQIEWLSIPDAYTRIKAMICNYALKLGKSDGDRVTLIREDLDIKLTHQLLATFAGLSRETVTIQINRLIKEGYISRQQNQIVVEKMDQLYKEING